MQGAAYTHACILCTMPQRGVEAESSQRMGSGVHAHLRLLHLVLGVHLHDDFVHVGLQDHSAHHHLRQNLVDLKQETSRPRVNCQYSNSQTNRCASILRNIKTSFTLSLQSCPPLLTPMKFKYIMWNIY